MNDNTFISNVTQVLHIHLQIVTGLYTVFKKLRKALTMRMLDDDGSSQSGNIKIARKKNLIGGVDESYLFITRCSHNYTAQSEL